MVFMSFRKPGPNEAENCMIASRHKSFNYDAKCVGLTRGGRSALTDKKLFGFAQDHTKVRVGTGIEKYLRCKAMLENWSHFQLPWAFVEPPTPLKVGSNVCVCGKSLFLWTLNPLKIVYVDSSSAPLTPIPMKHNAPRLLPNQAPHMQSHNGGTSGTMSVHTSKSHQDIEGRSFAYAHGTLEGHFLAGEERFGVEWNINDDSVWYEVLTFSRPAHILAVVTYPLVRHLQKRFGRESAEAVAKSLRGK